MNWLSFEDLLKKSAKMSPDRKVFAKILFCDVLLICNLATEFNGLVSKQDWLFPRPVLFIFDDDWLPFFIYIQLKIKDLSI
jgi:hypothetical protein